MSHYYEKLFDGTVEACHYVPMSSRPDELRPTRITDVRKWWNEGRKVEPSFTTVADVLNKAALINWKIDQHLIQAWKTASVLTPTGWGKGLDYFIPEVKRLTELQMDKAPSAGTDFHGSLEKYIQDLLPPEHEHYELCVKVFLRIYKETQVDPLLWRPEVKFVSDMGYGGMVDLNDNELWVIDYKTKQTADKFKPGKMAYDEHIMQLASCRMGLNLPNARCANAFVCLENGQIDFHEHSEEKLGRGWHLFQHALAIWQLQNGVT